VNTASGYNYQCVGVLVVSISFFRSGFEIISQASGLGMGIGRLLRPLRGIGEMTMQDGGLNSTRHVKVPPGAGVPQWHVHGVAVGLSIDRRGVRNMIQLTC